MSTGQLFLNMHHLNKLVHELMLSWLVTMYTFKRQFTNDVDFFFPFCVSSFIFAFYFITTCSPPNTIVFISANSAWRLGVLFGIAFMDMFTFFKDDLDKVLSLFVPLLHHWYKDDCFVFKVSTCYV